MSPRLHKFDHCAYILLKRLLKHDLRVVLQARAPGVDVLGGGDLEEAEDAEEVVLGDAPVVVAVVQVERELSHQLLGLQESLYLGHERVVIDRR